VDNGDPYAIPPDNPFVGSSDTLPEIWAIGLRNPWRYSFDRATGDLFIADVGQNAWEEVNIQRAGSRGGENYGWPAMEGMHCYQRGCDPARYVMPIAEYGRDGGCSVTGGHVYRGYEYPQLAGLYFFGDYCSGRMWALSEPSAGQWQMTELPRASIQISSFGEDEAGELYVAGYGDGRVYRVTAR
jgi:glucose/arabinose dehydrogenase